MATATATNGNGAVAALDEKKTVVATAQPRIVRPLGHL